MAEEDPILPHANTTAGYRVLDARTLPEEIRRMGEVRTLLGGGPDDWRVREVGDGNLNLVFIVEGPQGSICVKQALPYVRAAGPSWPMALQRAFFEYSYFLAVAPFVGERIPQIYHYDPGLYLMVMERLSPHIILRRGLIAGNRYGNVARDMGEYVARAGFFTSDLARPFERKLQGIALFAANQALIRISVDLIFIEPYIESSRNHHTSPQLDKIASDIRRDGPLKVAAARCGEKFLTQTQALIHGDLHSGSVMVTENDTRVIDPEFAFYGPIGFDLGAFFGNLLLSWYAQPGHANPADDRIAHQAWILEQARIFWETFRRCFLELWAAQPMGDAFPAAMLGAPEDKEIFRSAQHNYVDSLFADMVAFAACKMIRRILGFAHIVDFDSIPDANLRARCEANALNLAHLLLTHPQQFRSLEAVIDSVPRATDAGRTAPLRPTP